MLRIFCLLPMLFTLFGNGRVVLCFVRDRLNNLEQVDESSKILLEGGEAEVDEPNLPEYLRRLGKLGVNFDIDANTTDLEKMNKPFIFCEEYNYKECTQQDPELCTIIKKCYPDVTTHHLGCMAVLVYNTLENGTIQQEQQPTIKGCWSQEESEMRECLSDTECIVDTRRTGSLGRNAKFCCCKTHGCNGRFSTQIVTEEPTPVTDAPITGTAMSVENYWFIALSALFLLFLAATFFVACFVLTQALRRKFAKKGIKQIQSVNNRQPEDPLLSEVTLNDGSRVKLAEIQLVEKISDGRFGQVYRARVGGMFFAVKQFPEKEEDSWTNEMDLYNLKPLCKNDCIAKFLGGFQWDKKCWLLIKFYEKASLFDFLKSNTISLAEAVKMISTMLNGLAFLHEEIPSSSPDEKPTIVHRDLKSKNILVQDDLSTCITDFGLALRCDSKGISADQNHLQVGTRRYMSPEVLEGATEFTSFAFQQIDVYAAALVIWEVLSRTHIPEATDDEITPFMLPYEKEVGSNPSTIQIRDLVALQKYRPQIRPALLQNEVSTSITRTMREMWDHEPDGRITSSCARDRSRVWISETIT